MKTVFISQPMKGKTHEEIIEERKRVVSILKSKGYNVYDSVHKEASNTTHQSVWYLGKSLQMLSECDIAFFMKGHHEANGCMVEKEVCKRYGIPFYTKISYVPNVNENNNDLH